MDNGLKLYSGGVRKFKMTLRKTHVANGNSISGRADN
jgi:hypothetical protein